jgi:hypothetical protein
MVLGYGEARVLRPVLPAFAVARWTAATAAAAAGAWAAGFTPPAIHHLGAPAWAVVMAAVLAAVVVLLSLGGAQWTVLRHHLPNARWWVPANVVAWVAGLPPTFIFPALVPNGAPAWAFALAFLAAGGAMAGIVAAVLGRALVAMLERADGISAGRGRS